MKEIQGKIKFGVINVNENYKPKNIDEAQEKIDIKFLSMLDGNVLLSAITEEQAAEFVKKVNYTEREIDVCYKDYNSQWIVKIDGGYTESIGFDTAKESLISLLKANDVWIKEWKEKPTGKFIDTYTDTVDWNVGRARIDYNKLPDDLLLIKLT